MNTIKRILILTAVLCVFAGTFTRTALATAPAGGLTGEFSINTSGMATYAIPLPAPPGINGQSPKLKLNYTSAQTNGSLGIGWSLAGVSRITRCPPNMATDNMLAPITYGATDKFCLDGQRLIVTSGNYGADQSQYRTELESWQQITAHNDGTCGTGPCSFTVIDKTGQTRTYGASIGSGRILAQGQKDVRVWSVSSTSDLNGNQINYSYTLDPLKTGATTGAYYISSIDYTSNSNASFVSNRSIKFIYQPRPDNVLKYLGGTQIQETARLEHIVTYVGSTVVQDYRLNYDTDIKYPSRMNSVMACSSLGSEAICLPATTFQWTKPASKFSGETIALKKQFGINDSNWNTSLGRYLADVNGDGKSDIIGFGSNASDTQGVFVALSNGDTFGTPALWSSHFTSNDWSRDTNPVSLADVNADGMADIVGFGPNGVQVGLSNGSKFVYQPVFAHFGSNSGNWDPINNPRIVADVNGDGCSDIVGFGSSSVQVALANCTGGFNSPTPWTTHFTNSANWTDQTPRSVVDINGDGMADIIGFGYSGLDVMLSTGSSFTSSGWSTATYPHFLTGSTNWTNQSLRTFADVNGDGLADIVGINSNGINVALNTGNSFTTPSLWSSRFQLPSTSWNLSQTPIQVLDINGDNMADVVGFGYNAVKVALSNGSAFSETGWDQTSLPNFGSSTWNSQTPRHLADINGDGFVDVVGFGNSSVKAGLVKGSNPNVITSIIEGLGGEISVAYQSMSSDVYSDTSATQHLGGLGNASTAAQSVYPISGTAVTVGHPNILAGGMRQLVANYTKADGNPSQPKTNKYKYTLNYTNALMDIGGRGWQGFKTKTITDTSSGDISVTTYHQAFPLTGHPISITKQCTQGTGFDPKCLTTGTILHSKNLTYNQTVTATGSASTTPNVYATPVATTRQDYYDYGNYQFSIGSSYGYDLWGNQNLHSYLGYVSQTGVDQSPSDNVYTLQQFYPPAAGTWQLAYPQYQKVSTQNTPSTIGTFVNGTDLSLTYLTYSTDGRMNLASREHWDNTNNAFLTYSYQYDQFGNKTGITDPANNTTTITYEPTYNTFKSSKTSPSNEAGVQLTTQYGYDPRFGKLTATTGPNGNTHTLCYDDFGRLAAKQAPSPQDLTGVTTANNCVTGLVTGSTSVATAPLVTVEKYKHTTGDSGNYCHVTEQLVAWPLNNAAAVYNPSTVCVDGLGRHRQTSVLTSGGTSLETISYDSRNLPTSKTLPHFTNNSTPVSTTTVYDAYGRLTKSKAPSGPDGSTTVEKTISHTINATGSEATITEAANSSAPYVKSIYHKIVNGKPKLHKMIVPGDNNATTYYNHDVLGRRIAATDPIGVYSSLQRDSLGRTQWTSNPVHGTISFQYAANGVLQTKTDAKGITTYAYDNLGRMLSKTFFDGTSAAFGYDDAAVTNGLGRMTSTSTADGDSNTVSSKTLGYDANGKLASTSLSVLGQTFSSSFLNYPDGALYQLTYPDSTVLTRERNAYGELKNLSIGSTNYATYTDYAPNGQAQTVTYGNGLVESRTYWPLGQQGSYSIADSGGTALYGETYDWDKLGLLSSITDTVKYEGTDLSQTFGYTSMRLTSATGVYGDKGYQYDNGGNLTALNPDSATDKVTYSYGTSPSQQVAGGVNQANASVFSASYDPLGNTQTMLADSTSWAFSYDPQNRMSQAINETGNTTTTFGYDANASRIWKTSPNGQQTIYGGHFEYVSLPGGGSKIINYIGDRRKRVASITTTKASAASGETAAPATKTIYYHRDYRGSTVATSDSAASVTALAARVAYDPLGSIYSISGPDNFNRKFAGLELDSETGLYDHSARYFDSSLGRFISADSGLGADWTRQDAQNRYAYALNAATSYRDIGGRAACSFGSRNLATGVGLLTGASLTITGGIVGYDAANADSVKGPGAFYGALGGMASGAGLGAGTYVICESLKKSARRSALSEEEDDEIQRPLNPPEITQDGVTQAMLDCLCFTSKTLVSTAGGAKPIEAIASGDTVWSYNFGTSKATQQKVARQTAHAKPVKHLVRISVGGSLIEVTPEHPFWLPTRAEWVPASQLRQGDKLLSKSGKELAVTSIENVDGDFLVYNFEVENAHNYYVSEAEVLVHNNTCQRPKFDTEEETEVGADEATANSEAAADAELGAATSAVDATSDVAATTTGAAAAAGTASGGAGALAATTVGAAAEAAAAPAEVSAVETLLDVLAAF